MSDFNPTGILDISNTGGQSPLGLVIFNMEWIDDQFLIVSGSFDRVFDFESGKGIGLFDPESESMHMLSLISGPVHDFHFDENRLIVGGNFQSDGQGNDLNNLAYSDGYLGLEKNLLTKNDFVYP